jgi:hypothetical protein
MRTFVDWAAVNFAYISIGMLVRISANFILRVTIVFGREAAPIFSPRLIRIGFNRNCDLLRRDGELFGGGTEQRDLAVGHCFGERTISLLKAQDHLFSFPPRNCMYR